MGEHDETGGGLLLNGLLPNEAGSVMRVLGDGDSDRWLKAEERTAVLIACIQPNPPSEGRRNAVTHYVQRLIRKCFPCDCEVFTFGSVPLKTYLPDGDIDFTVFSEDQKTKESWAHEICNMLENEEKNENAEFHVKEVQYIQAKVKIIQCLVDNIKVDISFNQLGGLRTLCFLEEVDNLINQNHIFKRSIILIKAWCYYESRIQGAHYGLISTYALETLVLYIFHVFNNSFAGPLEVLYRFLEFFSKFDWDNFCVSLWGPVPISSIPDVTAESPRKDGGELLLSKSLLACTTAYAVLPGGQENQGQPFVSKHFNVIDPLCKNDNLGRSVSKGNFSRIRSAFALGANRLARLLDCPKEDLFFEVNQFFLDTWDRHGSGHRPDAPRNDLWRLRLSALDQLHVSESLRSNSSSQRNDIFSGHETQVGGTRGSGSVSSQHGNHSLESSSRTSDVSTVSHTRVKRVMATQSTQGSLIRLGGKSDPPSKKKKRWEISSNQGSMRDDHVDTLQYQDNRGNEVCHDDRTSSFRSLPSATPSSVKSKTSSESSFEGSSVKISKSTREKQGRRTAGFESAQTSGSESLIPIAPMLLGPGSRQRNPDGSGVPTFSYPTGPPVPFVTTLPVYNFPTEAGTSDSSMSQFSGEEGLDSSDSSQNFDSSEGLDLREVLSTNSVRSTVPIELLEHKSDILNSDFASHWQNLQYGRLCQNSRYPGPLIYPSPGRFPSDGPGRPLSNVNLFTQLMSYGPHFVPVAPLQSVSNRPAAVLPRYGDEIPRYRSGTGTYLPNPKLSARDRQSTGARRGNYSYDRSDHHGDREGNWNINPKSRAAGCSHSRTQAEKPNSRSDRLAASESRTDRPWGSHRRDSFPSHQSQNGPVCSNSVQSSPSNVTYGMYPLPTMNASGVASNAGYGSHAEQLEFGSLGPVGLSGVNEVSQLNDGSQLSGAFEIHGVSAQRSSPDQPSSPHLRR